jgi:hypothetical protein
MNFPEREAVPQHDQRQLTGTLRPETILRIKGGFAEYDLPLEKYLLAA